MVSCTQQSWILRYDQVHNSMTIVYTMYITSMCMYVNVCTMYEHICTKYIQYLLIHFMKAVFWHIKKITFGTLWLPFHTPKGTQGTCSIWFCSAGVQPVTACQALSSESLWSSLPWNSSRCLELFGMYHVHTLHIHRQVHTVYIHVHTLYMGTTDYLHIPVYASLYCPCTMYVLCYHTGISHFVQTGFR